MHLYTSDTSDSAALAVAKLIASRVNSFHPSMNRKFALGLPTGITTLPVYHALERMCRDGLVSFEFVVTVNLDEYLGLPADHPQSCSYFMEQEFFSQVDIPPSQTHLLSGITIDPGLECARYEALIKSLGGIHLLFVGLGANGSLAFNEPGSSFASRTRVFALQEETREANARHFEAMDSVPTHAMSMGLGTILEADEIIVLATGQDKSQAVQASIERPITHLCPGTALQLHPEVHLVTDVAAASTLKESTKRYLTNESADLPPIGETAAHVPPKVICPMPRFSQTLPGAHSRFDALPKCMMPKSQDEGPHVSFEDPFKLPRNSEGHVGPRSPRTPTPAPESMSKRSSSSSVSPSGAEFEVPDAPQALSFQSQVLRRASGLKLITKLPFIKSMVSPDEEMVTRGDTKSKSEGASNTDREEAAHVPSWHGAEEHKEKGKGKGKEQHGDLNHSTLLAQGRLGVVENGDDHPSW